MFRTALNLSTSLADELRHLPSGCCTYVLDAAFLVVTPGGVFVMVEADEDVDASCRVAAERAASVRDQLADLVAWVPFIDAVVITDRIDVDPSQPALIVPPDLVRFTVAEGRRIIDHETVARLNLLRLPRLI